uniref:Uncharacterized protein n=1 Tax=viral metagenome TaxID=1070528 RepID=A0A6M3L4R9_9ZZZZ
MNKKDFQEYFERAGVINGIPVEFNPVKGEYRAFFPNGAITDGNFEDFIKKVEHAVEGVTVKLKEPLPIIYGDIMTGVSEADARIMSASSTGKVFIQIKTPKGGYKRKEVMLPMAVKHIFKPTDDNKEALELIGEAHKKVLDVMDEFETAQKLVKAMDVRGIIPPPPILEIPEEPEEEELEELIEEPMPIVRRRKSGIKVTKPKGKKPRAKKGKGKK